MTIRQKMLDLLTERGMFDSDAAKVVQSVIDDPSSDKAGMEGRWDSPVDSVAPFAMPALWMRVRRVAIRFTETDCPNAWYLPVLKDG